MSDTFTYRRYKLIKHYKIIGQIAADFKYAQLHKCMMKKSNMLYNEYIYKCIAVKWEDTGDVQEQHEFTRL